MRQEPYRNFETGKQELTCYVTAWFQAKLPLFLSVVAEEIGEALGNMITDKLSEV